MAVNITEDAKEEIKNKLLATGEKVSKDTAEFLFNLIEIVIKDTENKIDDAVLVFLPQIKEYVFKLLDNISKEV